VLQLYSSISTMERLMIDFVVPEPEEENLSFLAIAKEGKRIIAIAEHLFRKFPDLLEKNRHFFYSDQELADEYRISVSSIVAYRLGRDVPISTNISKWIEIQQNYCYSKKLKLWLPLSFQLTVE